MPTALRTRELHEKLQAHGTDAQPKTQRGGCKPNLPAAAAAPPPLPRCSHPGRPPRRPTRRHGSTQGSRGHQEHCQPASQARAARDHLVTVTASSSSRRHGSSTQAEDAAGFHAVHGSAWVTAVPPRPLVPLPAQAQAGGSLFLPRQLIYSTSICKSSASPRPSAPLAPRIREARRPALAVVSHGSAQTEQQDSACKGARRKRRRRAFCQGPGKRAGLLGETCWHDAPPPRSAEPFKINFYKRFQNELILGSAEPGCPLLTQHRSPCQTQTLCNGK